MTLPREKALLRLLLHAYPDRVTVRRANDPTRGVMVGGRGVVLEPSSVVRTAPLFLSIDARDAGGGASARGKAAPGAGERADESRVSLAGAIEPQWLSEVYPQLIQTRILHRYLPEREKVQSLRQTLFVDLVLREEAVGAAADPEGASLALFGHVRTHPEVLHQRDEAFFKALCRLRFLFRALPELELFDPDGPVFEEVLREACAGQNRLEALLRGRLRSLLEGRLSWRQKRALEIHAPEAFEVPSGNRIRLTYPPDASPPILAVRLQELFGLAETPRVADGRIPVVLHLLGPNYRPVQITTDLKSFWTTGYAEVRKDLRARYPRHPWPEDPWNAPAVSVGGRRRRP